MTRLSAVPTSSRVPNGVSCPIALQVLGPSDRYLVPKLLTFTNEATLLLPENLPPLEQLDAIEAACKHVREQLLKPRLQLVGSRRRGSK